MILDKLEEIERIGIPRALLFYRYGVLWKTFFEELGIDVVLSSNTDKEIYEQGDRFSVDECCVASKMFMGHAADLLGKCDALFIPGYASCDPRAGFCTKYQSLPDLVNNTFGENNVKIVSMLIERISDAKQCKKAYIDLGYRLGRSKKQASLAYDKACRAQDLAYKEAAERQEALLKELKEEDGSICILLMAHPYIGHDDYVSGIVRDSIEDAGATLIYADETDKKKAFKKSFQFSETLPWIINRELVGSLLMNKDVVDGIVLMSAFPCGPDSMFDDAIVRSVKGVPILNLMIDMQSGNAGIQTRVESFIDILRFKKIGGYLNER